MTAPDSRVPPSSKKTVQGDHDSAASDIGLSILARSPEIGRVKSRLARHVGVAQALRIHIELLRYNVEVALATKLPLELVVAGDMQQPWLQRLADQYAIPLEAQSEGDIGARMLATAQRSEARGMSSIIIGSDCALMSPEYIFTAVAELQAGARVVLGPAEDGGYVLVGQRRPVTALFDGISWGSSSVLQQSRAALCAAHIDWQELAPLWDVDGVADLRRLRQHDAQHT